MSEFVVPVVDLRPYVSDGTPAERAATAQALDAACRAVGFVQIVGHAVPESVIAGLAAAMDAFFALDLATKRGWVRPAGENRGYSPPRSESLSYSLGVDPVTRMNDFFEAFNVGASEADYPGFRATTGDYAASTWPEVDGFRPAVEAYFAEARRVALTLQDAFADALGVPRERFARASRHPINVLRMNNYALDEGDLELDADLTGMGEHTDYGLVTVLWADQVAGLQVLGTDQVWHDVLPADGALLVNLGDIGARLTNDHWRSSLHRVKPPVVDGRIRRRRSAAFFHDWDADALIETLPRFVADEAALYDAVTVSEHVQAKLRGSRAGVANPEAARERARVQDARTAAG